jgi:hypothetical protein
MRCLTPSSMPHVPRSKTWRPYHPHQQVGERSSRGGRRSVERRDWLKVITSNAMEKLFARNVHKVFSEQQFGKAARRRSGGFNWIFYYHDRASVDHVQWIWSISGRGGSMLSAAWKAAGTRERPNVSRCRAFLRESGGASSTNVERQ